MVDDRYITTFCSLLRCGGWISAQGDHFLAPHASESNDSGHVRCHHPCQIDFGGEIHQLSHVLQLVNFICWLLIWMRPGLVSSDSGALESCISLFQLLDSFHGSISAYADRLNSVFVHLL